MAEDEFLYDYETMKAREKEILLTKQAEEIIKRPDLLKLMVEEVNNNGVVGEQETIHVIHLVKAMSLVQNSRPESSNLFLSDSSGVGKDYILKKTLELWPEETNYHKQKVTPELLAYTHNAVDEPEWTWNGKSLHVEEISEAVLNSDTFTAYCSTRNFSGEVLIKQKPFLLKINGKPSIFITTASKNPKEDQLRRFAFISLDDSNSQTEAIVKKQWKDDEEAGYNRAITKALNKLEIVKVKIPFGNLISKPLLSRVKVNVILRTANSRFMDFIKASAAVNQYQRKKDDKGCVIAQLEDYENALRAFKKIAPLRSLSPLTKEKKKLLEIIKNLGNEVYPVSDIEPKVTFVSQKTLYLYLRELADKDFLSSIKIDAPDSLGRVHKVTGYGYIGQDALVFPTIEELQTIQTSKTIQTIQTIQTTTEKQESEKKVVLPVSLVLPVFPNLPVLPDKEPELEVEHEFPLIHSPDKAIPKGEHYEN